MVINPIFAWLAVGIIILLLNKWSGRNLMPASYAALMVSFFILVGIMKVPSPTDPDYGYYMFYVVGQIIVFLAGWAVWAFVMRDSAPKSKLGAKSREFYMNIIGRTVEVSSGGINAVSGGEVILDGKIMDAKLPAYSELTSIKAGTKMQVQEVIGDTLIVIPGAE